MKEFKAVRPLREGQHVGLDDVVLVEVVRRCPYCQRENPVGAMSYAENPYCNLCLHERLEKASKRRELDEGPFFTTHVGHYFTHVSLKSMVDLPGCHC